MSDVLHNLSTLWTAIGIVLGALLVLGTIVTALTAAVHELIRWHTRRHPQPVRVTRTPTLPSDWQPYRTPTTRDWN